MEQKIGYVYIITNKPNGILYIGVTSNLAQRVYQHKQKQVEGFSKKYGLNRLVYYESLPSIEEAIDAEKKMKLWKRAWKVKRILQTNPAWEDLYERINM